MPTIYHLPPRDGDDSIVSIEHLSTGVVIVYKQGIVEPFDEQGKIIATRRCGPLVRKQAMDSTVI